MSRPFAKQTVSYDQIELERRRVGELDIRIRHLQEKIELGRSKMGGINASKEIQTAVQKQIKILESRLEQANIKYNEVMHLRS